ncbi:hypothetical protein DMB92_03025 [Campylobacter sp. MIT 99-7217]|uniref:PDDEXK-like family protein n=1 Tax=Campylobacter sp. MIT 99-7217 TaxID=535091 RepID=UPI00115A207F|nr:PD-(D/E)XK nuclease family protein [Campylobacter sp. MIT 99-7217]TQR33868.1 hypothetical protein DMB92_03025 [Campylobacter sp. MIT 99-7217]
MQKFIKGLLETGKTFEKEVKEGLSHINIFEALDIQTREFYHSKFIAYLLDQDKGHYQKSFAEQFLKRLGLQKELKDSNFKNLKVEDIKAVKTEYTTKNKRRNNNKKNDRRIDILIELSQQRFILIENKINAGDSENQLKDYISFLKKKADYQNILTIYLHPKGVEPSKTSLGSFSIDGNLILDKNKNKLSHYFGMKYKWIKDWLDECVKIYEKRLKASNFTRNFTQDTQNIISSLKQYKDILKRHIIIDEHKKDEHKKEDDVLSFILKGARENLKNAMLLYRYSKNKAELKDIDKLDYERAKELIQHKWEGICEALMRDFFAKFEKGFKIGKEGFVGLKLDEDRVNYDNFAFYPKAYEGDNIRPLIGFYFNKSKYNSFGLTLRVENESGEKNKKYEKCLELFKDKQGENVGKAWDHYYCERLINDKKLDGEYAFIYWLIENEDWLVKFKELLKNFLDKKPIKETLDEINKILRA